ncbi:MAG: PEP-CTERM sorting domain-containing protein [Desulfosarcina sp.]|nr:PEP-CTERM sorting domain-containing protein [Desulfobacterales bacterium]
MFRKSAGICFLLILLALFVIPGNSHAIQFGGEAWLANHVDTSEYYLLINGAGLTIDPGTVKLKGFKFKSSPVERDFSQLTQQAGNDGIAFFEIDNSKKKFRRWAKKASKKARKLTKKDQLSEEGQGAWIDEYMNAKLAGKVFKLKFKDAAGEKYKAKIAFATFENPPLPESSVDIPGPDPVVPETGSTSIPEPATLILLGAGMLGLGVLRRFKS